MTAQTRVAVALLLVLACSRREGPESRSLLVVTALRGTTEPCGCTSHPLGGLDRMAARIEAHRNAGARWWLLVGDTYFEHAQPPEHARGEADAKAAVIDDIVRELTPTSHVTGPTDAAHDRNQASPTRTVTLAGGTKVALFTRPMLDSMSCESLRNEAARAVVDARVLLLAEDTPQARACDSGVDIVLVPGGEEPRAPRLAGNALWIDAGDKGRYIGQLSFFPGPPGAWTFYDEGRSARITNDAKRERLRAEIEALANGPAKNARKAKLAALEAETISVEKPNGRYVTWKLETIDDTVEPAKWATEKLQGFNKSLCDITKASTRSRTCERAPTIADQYVGSATCRGCHADAFNMYATTKHAHAWATLESASKNCDLSCIGCHSVGYEKPGGYCRLDDVEDFKNVGCESCHGPGRGHAMNPVDRSTWSKEFRRGREPAICTGCHNHEHSDLFDFRTYLPRILGPGHGQPLSH